MYENSMEEIYKAQNGNQEAMSKLVKQNSGLVWSIVKSKKVKQKYIIEKFKKSIA